VMAEALAQAKAGRTHILHEMKKCSPPPRMELGPYTARVLQVSVDPTLVRETPPPPLPACEAVHRVAGGLSPMNSLSPHICFALAPIKQPVLMMMLLPISFLLFSAS